MSRREALARGCGAGARRRGSACRLGAACWRRGLWGSVQAPSGGSGQAGPPTAGGHELPGCPTRAAPHCLLSSCLPPGLKTLEGWLPGAAPIFRGGG